LEVKHTAINYTVSPIRNLLIDRFNLREDLCDRHLFMSVRDTNVSVSALNSTKNSHPVKCHSQAQLIPLPSEESLTIVTSRMLEETGKTHAFTSPIREVVVSNPQMIITGHSVE
jgi:hypothetical protein